MSATDRYEVYSEKCPCGKGKLVVESCSPDHGFAKADDYWYEAEINCASCSKTHRIEVTSSGSSRGYNKGKTLLHEISSGVSKVIYTPKR